MPRRDSPIPQLSLNDDLASLAAAIDDAYSTSGFAYLCDHSIDSDLLAHLFDCSRAFHALPLTQKMAIEVNRWHRGYIPLNTSINRTSSIASVSKPNQSESLMIMHEPPDGGDSSEYLAGPNQWPEQQPQLKAVATAYTTEISRVCLHLLKAIELALGQQPGRLQQHFRSPTTFLRLLHYPPQASEAGLYGSAPHTDYGFITLLAQDDTGGLQVRRPDGGWFDVPPQKDALIMNAGDMLQRFSNGRFISTPHRVVNHSGQQRFSIPFFFDPNVLTTVTPLPGKGEEPRFPSVCYGDYLRERLEKNHSQHQRQAP